MKKFLFGMMAIAAMMVACQSEKVPTFLQLPALPFSVEGTHADLVKGANSEWFFLRDSVANEDTDTIYSVITDAKLRVEKTFEAEKMDTFPQLKVISPSGEVLIEMEVQDSAVIRDLLYFYLKDHAGFEREIRFVGKTSKSKFLQLPQTKQIVMTHFSLYDPEAHANPEITKMIDEYLGCYKTVKELLESGLPAGSTTMMRQFGYVEDFEAQLKKKEKDMTAGQMKRYKGIYNDLRKLVAKYDY